MCDDMWFMSNKYQVLFFIVFTAIHDKARCEAISNTNFNSYIRDYATVDINNITNVKTLQKEDLGKLVTFTPASNPIKFKEIPDSALSSSSNDRGLLYHDQPGYAINDYEESPHYSHGHDYHLYDPHPDVHGPPSFEHDHHNSYHHNDHHDPHDHRNYYDSHGHGQHYSGHGHHHSDHGLYYNKHYKHALAAKTVLWPIAGLALLGAAAALVSNPVLLQLGVLSGKRRRRDTEEIIGPDFPSDTFTKYADKIMQQSNEGKRKKQTRILRIASLTESSKRRVLKTDNLRNIQSNAEISKIRSPIKINVNQVTTYPANYNSNIDVDRFIPIPIKLRTPKVTE